MHEIHSYLYCIEENEIKILEGVVDTGVIHKLGVFYAYEKREPIICAPHCATLHNGPNVWFEESNEIAWDLAKSMFLTEITKRIEKAAEDVIRLSKLKTSIEMCSYVKKYREE